MSGTAGPNLGLAWGWLSGENGWGAGGFNPNFALLDAVTQLCALSRTASVPGSPAAGALYIVPAGATGAWSGRDLDIAVYRNSAWVFIEPKVGFLAFIVDTSEVRVWNGTAWVRPRERFSLGWALGSEVDDIVAGTAIVTDFLPHNVLITDVMACLSTPSGSGDVTVDVNIGGSSIFSTNPTIQVSEDTSLTGTPGTIATPSHSRGAKITFDIDADGTAAKGLKIWLTGWWTE